MKLERILENLNSFEKNTFLKVVDAILTNKPKNSQQIENILNEKSRDLKNMDNINVAKVFNLVQEEFAVYIKDLFINSAQFDLVVDIITRDGNCIMKQDWFARLYDSEIQNFEVKVTNFRNLLFDDVKSEVEENRKRDYRIYHSCVQTAFHNDELDNLDKKITPNEMSILTTLADALQLSKEEVTLINYLVIPIQKRGIDDVISELKATGVVFYSKKYNTLFIPDEIVRLLRKVRGKEVADKYFRRVLRLLREPQINLICKRHNIDWRLPIEEKIRNIISEGISFTEVVANEIHKEGTSLSDRKQFLNDFCENELKIGILRGATLDEKIQS